MHVEVAFVLHSHHHKFIYVLRPVDELLVHIAGAVARLDNFPAIVIEYHRPVVLSSVGYSLLNPPAQTVVAGCLDRDAAVHP